MHIYTTVVDTEHTSFGSMGLVAASSVIGETIGTGSVIPDTSRLYSPLNRFASRPLILRPRKWDGDGN